MSVKTQAEFYVSLKYEHCGGMLFCSYVHVLAKAIYKEDKSTNGIAKASVNQAQEAVHFP